MLTGNPASWKSLAIQSGVSVGAAAVFGLYWGTPPKERISMERTPPYHYAFGLTSIPYTVNCWLTQTDHRIMNNPKEPQVFRVLTRMMSAPRRALTHTAVAIPLGFAFGYFFLPIAYTLAAGDILLEDKKKKHKDDKDEK
jgi:hypothetical protein